MRILNGIYIFTVLLFVIDGFSLVEIKNQFLKSYVYFGIMVETPIILILNFAAIKPIKLKILGVAFPLLILSGIMYLEPLRIVFASSVWKTNTIYYQNTHWDCKKVEDQMKGLGAFGRNRRTVEVTYLTNLFIIVRDTSDRVYDSPEWEHINVFVNEPGIKYP
ncbi:MAG: hypothetical protein KAH48_06930 [Chlorobi bacterium]|nr:hypothetical protein [Chlorobiota bacterium]